MTGPAPMLIAGFLALVSFCAVSLAQQQAGKPRVPPGVDPGGRTIALVGNGVDYRRPEIAARLARDGEGEIVGWDFLDDDRRPFGRCSTSDDRCAAIDIAEIVRLPVRLVVMRAAIGSPQTVVGAVTLAARVDAGIVLLATDPPIPAAFLVDAAARFPALAFVARVSAEGTATALRGANFIGVRGSAATYTELAAAAVACATATTTTATISATLSCAEAKVRP